MATIQLLTDYAGERTGERRIWPGVYLDSDPVLCGLAEYLVANGYATWIDGTPVPVALTTTATDNLTGIAVEPTSDTHEVQDEIEHNGRKLQRRKPKA